MREFNSTSLINSYLRHCLVYFKKCPNDKMANQI